MSRTQSKIKVDIPCFEFIRDVIKQFSDNKASVILLFLVIDKINIIDNHFINYINCLIWFVNISKFVKK